MNLETLTDLAYYFRDSKCFGLLILTPICPALFL